MVESMKPKLIKNMRAEVYHSGPEVSSTLLKHLNVSPAHAYAYMTEKTEPTALMKFGTAWHAHFFEPSEFEKNYVVVPLGLDRRTKDGKAAWSDIEATGKEPISHDNRVAIGRMTTNANALEMTAQIMSSGAEKLSECSIFSEIDGVAIRIRPDQLVMPCKEFPHGLIIDGKTCADASPSGFGRHAWNNGFHIQAALNSHTVARLFELDIPFAPFAWLSVERGSPHCALYHYAPEILLQYGWEEVQRLIGELRVCRETGIWLGYRQDSQELVLPSYALREIEGGGEVSFEEIE
jgi:hypothetical protein